MKKYKVKQKPKHYNKDDGMIGKWLNIDYPNQVHKSKKYYTRKTKHKINFRED